MNRIMVFGRPESGKSTFATKLGAALGIPVHHLDRHFSTGYLKSELSIEVEGELIIEASFDREIPLGASSQGHANGIAIASPIFDIEKSMGERGIHRVVEITLCPGPFKRSVRDDIDPTGYRDDIRDAPRDLPFRVLKPGVDVVG